MAIITINPLEIIDGDDTTVIDLQVVGDPNCDPDALIDAIAEVQDVDEHLTRRLLGYADAHHGVFFGVASPGEPATVLDGPRARTVKRLRASFERGHTEQLPCVINPDGGHVVISRALLDLPL